MPKEETKPLPKPRNDADAYDVRERIAVGTGAIVYRAVEIETDTEVLFKVLQPEEMQNPLDLACVLARRTELARVKHPNVAQLLDVFEDDEGSVLVYNYMAGKGGQLCPKDSVLTHAEARAVARQLCDALLAGEDAECPHGEIKPSNIIIARGGSAGPVVQVQDWGLAECRKGDLPDETLLFMAPERLKGGAPDFSSDLFSVAATLIFLLTGHVPVQGASRDELLKAWTSFDIAALKPIRPDLEASFVQWIGWLMRVKLRDRPDSVEKACEVLVKCIAYGEALDKKKAKAAKAASIQEEPSTSATAAKAPAERVQLPSAAAPKAAPARPSQKTTAPVAQQIAVAAPALAPAPGKNAAPESDSNKIFRWVFIGFVACAVIAGAVWIYDQRDSMEWPWKKWFEKSPASVTQVEQPIPEPAKAQEPPKPEPVNPAPKQKKKSNRPDPKKPAP